MGDVLKKRWLRVTVILLVVLVALFVVADRLAANYVEGKVAEKIRDREGLDADPDVSIGGFPFLTQAASKEFDQVDIGMDDYRADTENPDGRGPGTLLIRRLDAHMKDVTISSGADSAVAKSADGTATVTYDELMKSLDPKPVEVATGTTAKVVGLSDGGQGRLKVRVEVKATLMGAPLTKTLDLLSTVKVKNDSLSVYAGGLGALPLPVAEDKARGVTDFERPIKGLPEGLHLDTVKASEEGVVFTVKGSEVHLSN